jgi:hypothetical protein
VSKHKRGEKHGSRRLNQIGGFKRKNKIAVQFVWLSREMLESPAWRALSWQARKVLDRLSLENMYHGGKDNGHLPCRYEDFIQYGCRKHAVSAALIEVDVLGFAKTVTLGTRAIGDIPGKASTYRLTWLSTHNPAAPETNEWRRFKTVAEAKAAVRRALKERSEWLDKAKGSPRNRQKKFSEPAHETGARDNVIISKIA